MLKKKKFEYITLYRETSSENGKNFYAVFRNTDNEALGSIICNPEQIENTFFSNIFESFSSPSFQEIINYIENQVK